MGVPNFLESIRAKVGNDLLVLPSVSGALFDGDRRLLLIRHALDGKWVMPGGIVEPDEHPADRVVRELREETGLVVDVVRLLTVCGGPHCRVVYGNGDAVSYVVTVYECRAVGGVLTPDELESLELGYFSEAEIRGMELSAIGRAITSAVFGETVGAGRRGSSSQR